MSNRLKNESSPYLLLHAEQKIDWFPWGREAFAKAKEENKPIFLSIGYSTCHWCHVMAEESFDHDDIADILNRAFVSIKVDREEKPDVDAVYMNICNAMHGSGGWPLSVFLTPDQKPFFVGTYFPRESSGNRIGFRDLLLIIDEKWRSDRSGLEHTSEEIVDRISLFLKREKTDDTSDPFIEAFRSLSESYDSEFGGFGHGAKFPTPQKLLFLEEYYECEKDRNCYNMLKNTLDAMAGGGLYDAIGGGFFRYSVDRAFSLPHFEKMLRDNALLIIVYAKFYELSGDLFYLQIAEDTAFYLLSEMKSNDHCFFTAQDADSEGEEGGYYLFDKNELAQILGEEDAKRFVNRYGMKDKPWVIAANKLDILTEQEREAVLKKLRDRYERDGIRIFPISAATGEGLNELLYYVSELVEKNKDEGPRFEQEYFPEYHIPVSEPYTVSYDKKNNEYVIEGPRIEKMLGYTNLNSEKGFLFFQKFIKDNGIDEELKKLGIQEGDTVRMYGHYFEYFA